MAWALMKSTSFPCAISGEIKVRSKQCGNKKRVIKMKCSLQTPPMRVRTFSGLRGVNNMGNISLDFHSTVTSVWSEKAFKIEPSSVFTLGCEKVIERAKEEARRLNHNFVGTEMILLGLIDDDEATTDITSEVFESMGIKLEDARNEVEKMIGRGSDSVLKKEIPLTPRARNVFQVSLEEAQRTGLYINEYGGIRSEHLLLGLLREGGCVVSRVLMNLGAYPNNIRTQVIEMAEEKAEVDRYGMTPTLKEYGINITNLADEKELHPVVGREAEIERVVHILDRHTKKNPCLIGEHGVGKTAIVEGVAQKLVDGYGGGSYNRVEVISLDVRVLVRGEFEERLRKIMEEINQRDHIILFIDDVHTLTATGAPEGGISATNILKQALASGEMQCIGATTPDEYRKHLEKDPSFQRLFQPVNVLEPTVYETLKILTGIRERFEDHHSDVCYTHEALVAAVQLSNEYISDGFLPGKAIDLIDEAGSRVNRRHYQARSNSKLVEKLNEMKELRPIEIERVEKELDRVKQLRSITIEGIGQVPDRDLEKAGMLRDLQIDRNFDIWSIEERIKEMNKAGKFGADVVTKRDIEDTVAAWDFHN